MDGAALAARIRQELKDEIAELGRIGLATILVGDDPASDIYIRYKHRAADEVGIEAIDKRLPATTPEEQVIELVEDLNDDESVDGILVQTPLPDHIDEARVMRTIEPIKDVDGLNPFSAGQLYLGQQTLVPATPLGVMQLLDEYEIDQDVLKLVSKDVCDKHKIIPVSRAGSSLIMAMADPTNLHAIDDIKFEGYANLETTSPSGDVEADTRRNLDYLRKLMNA